ncbi:OmpP1/FadL family transporter [Pelomicrobium sp. G1]|uniref:OmpP1/FadL family transporter n=1 Tax=unclassified Pelomicrobium TaxID=2815318 RepID=UPI003F7610AA
MAKVRWKKTKGKERIWQAGDSSAMRKGAVALLLATPIAFSTSEAFAINGLLFYGLGAKNRAMGGAGAAAPLDTSTVLINPAGLSHIENSADIGVHFLNARRFLDTSNGRGIAQGGVVNTAPGKQDSDQDIYVTPFSGLSYRPAGSRWTFGATVAGVAGEGAQYGQPRIDPSLLTPPGANYDTSSFLFIIKGIPAVSYAVTDQLSVGVGVHINAALFSTDSALGQPGFPQTQGDGRLEIAYGIGGQVGVMYKIDRQWAVGASFTSPQVFTDFGRYEDIIPNFKLPPEVRVGAAYRPTDKLLLALDYKWIGWTQVGLFDRLPSEGGFGWRDQHTVGAGVQYDWSQALTVRAGVNYGRTPLRDNVIFANALVPVVYETHLALGGEYRFDKRTSLSFSVVRTLRNTQTDNGTGDLFSQLGSGTRIGYNGWDADIQWSLKF